MIKAVTSGTLAPYFYVNDDNELTGVDIDIVKEVFNRLPQYELKIEQADALQGVLSGQYDIAVNNYGYTDERAESYYFSLPYKTSFNEYIQRTGDEPLTSLTDLADRGYKIELSAGSLTANALEKWNTDNPDHQINIVYSNANFQVRYQHIVDGTADVAIDDGPIIDNLLPQFGLEGQLKANEIDEETEDFLFPQNNTYFLFEKNEEGAALREDVDKALKEMKEDGTLSKITTEYLGVDTSPDEKYFDENIRFPILKGAKNMAEIYRVEKGSEEWKYKAYDYVRTDAFCCGQNIPIELEFGQDESKDDLQAILLTEDHKPVAGCRIAFPAEKTGKIERVCVVREKQKSGYGRVLIEAAEKWLKEYGVDHIVITSQDRAAGFYEKLGYKLNPDADLSVYDHHAPKKDEEPKKPKKNLGFTCVLVEKYV